MGKHSITLEFEDAESLHQALEFLGDVDAPVFITGGTVEADGRTFGLWDDFGAAVKHLADPAESEGPPCAPPTEAGED